MPLSALPLGPAQAGGRRHHAHGRGGCDVRLIRRLEVLDAPVALSPQADGGTVHPIDGGASALPVGPDGDPFVGGAVPLWGKRLPPLPTPLEQDGVARLETAGIHRREAPPGSLRGASVVAVISGLGVQIVGSPCRLDRGRRPVVPEAIHLLGGSRELGPAAPGVLFVVERVALRSCREVQRERNRLDLNLTPEELQIQGVLARPFDVHLSPEPRRPRIGSVGYPLRIRVGCDEHARAGAVQRLPSVQVPGQRRRVPSLAGDLQPDIPDPWRRQHHLAAERPLLECPSRGDDRQAASRLRGLGVFGATCPHTDACGQQRCRQHGHRSGDSHSSAFLSCSITGQAGP